MTHAELWVYYLAGAFAALLWKFLVYHRTGRRLGKPFRAILDEWIFEASPENAVSWVATVLIVWCAGVLFIDDVTLAGGAWVKKVPSPPAFAALLGYGMEYTAPNVAKWILSKTPWASPEGK